MNVVLFLGKVEVTLLAARYVEAAHNFLFIRFRADNVGYVMYGFALQARFFNGESMRERGKLPLKIRFRSTKISETAKSV